MKTSELLLRAIANERGTIPAVKFDKWLGQLITAGLIEKHTANDEFYYRLTRKSIEYLRGKGIEL